MSDALSSSTRMRERSICRERVTKREREGKQAKSKAIHDSNSTASQLSGVIDPQNTTERKYRIHHLLLKYTEDIAIF
jgi:hypothetical protein